VGWKEKLECRIRVDVGDGVGVGVV
jgi:hypothetical protein